MEFFNHLKKEIKEKNSVVCVGLDPNPNKINNIVSFCSRVIEDTSDIAVTYKINSAFYEPYDWEDMLEITEKASKKAPVILDVKRGDIKYSSKYYSRLLNIADAVTVNPYLGFKSLEPFFEKKGGVFILCKTTSGTQIQEVGTEPLYLKIAKKAKNQNYNDIGLVVGATEKKALDKIRNICDLPFLVPGIGAQGGDEEKAIYKGLNSKGVGLISSSRSIIYSDNPTIAAESLRKKLNIYRNNEK